MDIESGRREEVIQYVYERYGRRHAAQVANVITYRPRSALRDVGKALGHTTEEVGRLGGRDRPGRGASEAAGGPSGRRSLPPLVAELAAEVLDRPPPPRHPLGGHGASATGRWSRSARWSGAACRAAACCSGTRTTVPPSGWSSSTCSAWACSRPCTAWSTWWPTSTGRRSTWASLPQEDAVYDLLCRADTVGVFQVESRAQMGTLPRVAPRCFYDLAIEVALIRPGPIQGHAVNPYIRRRRGEEPVTYLHPLLEPILERTLGVPLFQEQLMEMAVAVAGFSAGRGRRAAPGHGGQALRRRAWPRLRDRLFAGMAARGVTGRGGRRRSSRRSAAFANFGFPESPLGVLRPPGVLLGLVKLHYPAAFTAGLLNAQPMGFWSPQSLVADASGTGCVVRRPHVNHSGGPSVPRAGGGPGADPAGRGRPARGCPRSAASGRTTAERIEAGGPGRACEDLVRRAGVTRAQLEALATAGALDGRDRRTGRGRPARGGRPAPAGVGGGGGRPGHRPTACRVVVRGRGPAAARRPAPGGGGRRPVGARPGPRHHGHGAGPGRPRPARAWCGPPRWPAAPAGDRVTVGRVVTHRQHPETARGAVFVNLEDETGMVNVVFSRGAWARWKPVARACPALLVRGRVERSEGSMTLVAERFEPSTLGPVPGSRDFR